MSGVSESSTKHRHGEREPRGLRRTLLLVPIVTVLGAVMLWLLWGPDALRGARIMVASDPELGLSVRCWSGRMPLLSGRLRLELVGPKGVVASDERPVDDNGVAHFHWPGRILGQGPAERIRLWDESGALLATSALPVGGVESSLGAVIPPQWVEGEGLRLRVRDGHLVVPFAGELVVERSSAAEEVELELSVEGARFVAGGTVRRRRLPVGVKTWRVRVVPLEHTVLAVVGPLSSSGARGLSVQLPVLPGGHSARLQGADLLVRSPTPRGNSYVNLHRDGRLLLVAAVALSQAGSHYGGLLPLPKLGGRVAVTTSSVPDMRSPAVAAWWLTEGDTGGLARPVRGEVLVDGWKQSEAAVAEQDKLLRQGVRLWVSLALLVQLGLGAAWWLRRGRGSLPLVVLAGLLVVAGYGLLALFLSGFP